MRKRFEKATKFEPNSIIVVSDRDLDEGSHARLTFKDIAKNDESAANADAVMSIVNIFYPLGYFCDPRMFQAGENISLTSRPE